MKKAKYFFMGIAILLLMGQTPQYLYRDLDMTGLNILNIGGFEEMKSIDWTEGTDVMSSSYYQSDGINDDLYGTLSMPVKIAGGQVVLDSLFICIWTQGDEDFINLYLMYSGCGTNYTSASGPNLGSGTSGWERHSLDVYDIETVDSCYKFWAACTNNAATDIKIQYCVELKYHTED